MTNMPMPTNLSQLRSLLGGLSYCPKYLPNLSKRIQPIIDILKKNVPFVFAKEMEAIVRDVLKILIERPVLCFPHWDAVQDGSRFFQFHTGVMLR